MTKDMRIYEDVKDLVEEEIDRIIKKGELDDKCLEYLDKLVDIAKDVDTIFAMHSEYDYDGYSQSRRPFYSYDEPMHGNSYMRRDSRGRYSNDYRSGGYMGHGYSREGDMRARLESMLNEAATEHEREAIRSALDRM